MDVPEQSAKDWKDDRADHLILLIGSNPLPNYVAARLLAKSTGAVLHLVHTTRTEAVAVRLAVALDTAPETDSLGGQFKINYHQVNEDLPLEVFKTVERIAHGVGTGKQLGLNYTGGNRTMSAHAYAAVDQAPGKPVFSYLNAGRLTMLIHDRERSARSLRADPLINMPLETLFQLHGLKPNPAKPPTLNPLQPDLAGALAKLHSTSEGVGAWFNWRTKGSANWSKLPVNEPHLSGFEEALRAMCAGRDPDPDRVARALGFDSLPSCAKWFKGGWLEHHTLAELQKAASGQEDADPPQLGVSRIRVVAGKPSSADFDLDVAIMRRYQLFAFSCIASKDAQACKDHLMEAYVRARQTGGDEARIGLVCAHPRPSELQEEIASDIDASGKIRVFGQRHLLNLAEEIRQRLDQQP